MDSNLTGILEASYLPQREAESKLGQMGYQYDNSLSSMDTKVFFDPRTNQPHIVYRGSTRVSDWLDNANLALGGKSKSRDEAIRVAIAAKDKYGKAPTTYGHSRGSIFAEDAGEATGGQSYTYNKAILPSDIFKKIRPEQTDVRTSKDIVSRLSGFQKGGTKVVIESPQSDSYLLAHQIKGANRFKIR